MIRTDPLPGHRDRVGGIAWHPQATLTLSPSVANIASGGGDSDVHLWSMTSYALKLGI
jgi:U4/U6 small nuclear ribonucleoprotein PRP4